MASLTLKEADSLRHLLTSVLHPVRMVAPGLQLNQLEVLLLIAVEPGISIVDLQSKANPPLSQSTAQGCVTVLLDWQKAGQRGYGFVRTARDPMDRRRVQCFLTAEGDRLIQKLLPKGT